jgi:hypothetical protein
VKSIEYFPDGGVKRVEFKDVSASAPDYRSTPITGPRTPDYYCSTPITGSRTVVIDTDDPLEVT